MDTVAISLDKERHLRYTWGSVRRLKRECGISFTDLDEDVEMDAGGFELMISLLWAGLVWEDRELTADDVADMVDLSRTAEVGETIARAIKLSTEATDPTPATV